MRDRDIRGRPAVTVPEDRRAFERYLQEALAALESMGGRPFTGTLTLHCAHGQIVKYQVTQTLRFLAT